MDKFQNKYRIPSARLPNWDYGKNASYFITICTANMEYYFGDVVNGEMNYSEIGKMANQYWLEIPDHFPFVKLDVHVVMPNHVHGIVIIDKLVRVETQNLASLQDSQNLASVRQDTQNTVPIFKNHFGPQSQNLASIIRGFKIGVTKYARNNNIIFAWQPRYHDHIIRNNKEYQRIKNYIINNPQKWEEDKFYKK